MKSEFSPQSMVTVHTYPNMKRVLFVSFSYHAKDITEFILYSC